MPEENQVTEVQSSTPNPSVIVTNKTAACAVSLGVAILNKLVGVEISNVSTENANELIATTINNALKI